MTDEPFAAVSEPAMAIGLTIPLTPLISADAAIE
jgi:hypothetical protein